MLIVPYSTALRLSRPPVVTYLVTLLCVLVFLWQIRSDITESLMYYPETWNPLKMITSSLVHGDWLHLIGNMIFYLAFAPALEVLLGSKLRYIWIMILISFVVGIAYSFSTLLVYGPAWPTLGFSGVVTGMIGLSAYLMPTARIRVFFWYLVMWKTFYVPAWVLAIAYIGMDTWAMFASDDYGGINVVAHVAGGFAGYLYGYFWLRDRKEEVQEELAHEIKAMSIKQKLGKTSAEAFRYSKEIEKTLAQKNEMQAQDKYLGNLYQMVTTHRDSEAIVLLLDKYDLHTATHELEQLFEHIEQWGPSRTLLCIGRLIIEQLAMEGRDGKVLVYIDKCQKISPQFVLADLSRVLHIAEFALDAGRPGITRNLVANAQKRYGDLVNCALCNHLFEKADSQCQPGESR